MTANWYDVPWHFTGRNYTHEHIRYVINLPFIFPYTDCIAMYKIILLSETLLNVLFLFSSKNS